MKINDIDRLQAAFEKTTAKNSHEQDDFLAEMLEANPGLASEVRFFLKHLSRENDPLEEFCDARQRISAASRMQDEQSFPKVSGYLVVRRIGTGGQADVYLARQGSTGQQVAIKVFRGLGLADSQRRRINAETEALARLHLSNVVPILDRGQTADGNEYLITRFIDGVPVDQAAAKMLAGDSQEVLELFAKIAETLARVHRHGIIHRDLKPSNILVDHDNEPYLLDFGLASFFADPSGRVLTATPAGEFQGSILWACPEQVDASFGAIDERSDIYSLGVVIYQSLTGRFPYSVDGGMLAVAQQIVRTRPDAMTDSAISNDPVVNSEVQAIVLRALEKKPSRRFQSADELAAALTSGGRRGSPSRQTTPFPKRLAVTLLLGVAGVLGVTSVLLTAADWNVAGSRSGNESETAAPTAPIVAEQETSMEVESPIISDNRLDDKLLPFGETPANWVQVGDLQNDHHEIERGDIRIEGDFTLRLDLSAGRAERAGVALTLIGEGTDGDLRITATKTNTWSDNETWELSTPAGLTRKGLPVDDHTLTLERRGQKITLRVDAVYRPDRSSNELATFAINESERFEAIRLSTTGPAMRLSRIRMDAVDGVQSTQ